MMKLKKIIFGFLILTLLSCNYVTQMIVPPTVTPIPPTVTLTASLTPTPDGLVPAYIPSECASAPLATVAPDLYVEPTQETDVDIPKEEELNIVKEVGSIVQDVYVYPDFNGKNWTEIESRYKEKIEAGVDAETFYTEMQNMITELGDDHSFFLSPLEVKETDEELKGDVDFVGVGIYATFDYERGRIIVNWVFPDSSADHAGIKAHDSILSVDKQSVSNDKTNRIRGPKCSAVLLTVQSPGEEPRQLMLVRESIEGNMRIDARLVSTTDGSKIGYIFIPTFFDETIPQQIEQALNDFGPLDGLILDVRMNTGGISTVTYPILSFFTSGRLGQFVSRDSSHDLSVDADPIHNSQTVPIVIVVSEGTASYGEIFAGIMRDSRGAKITGETSPGNVEVLHGYNFEDGSQLWIAAERFFAAHSHANWEDTGIVPDVQAYAEWDTFTFETDPSIAAAVSLLGHK